MDNFADGQFSDLAGFRPWDVVNRDNPRGNMARARSLTDCQPNLLFERVCQNRFRSQANELDNSYIIVPFLPYGQRLDDVGDFFDLSVDFGSTDPNASRIQCRV